MGIELINGWADTIEEAYGLSIKDLEMLDKILHEAISSGYVINIREHVIPLLNSLDYDTLKYIAEIIETSEHINIRSIIDIIEFICNVDNETGEKYLSIIFNYMYYKNDIL